MTSYDLIIRNGTIVTTENETQQDIAITGGTIVAIGSNLPGVAHEATDAAGCYIFPGFIDPHVHLSLPVGGGLISSDDFASGTIAAACGGTTTIIDFTTQARGVTLERAVAERRAQAEGQVAVDYALHLTVTDAGRQTLADLSRLAANGYPSLKLYMTYADLMVRDHAMLHIMRTAADCGALTLVHAENHDIILFLTRQLLGEGRTSPVAHALSRPAWVEAEAVGRAIALARAASAPLYIVHVSCAEALSPIERARQEGQPVFGETCPHYLLLSDEEYSRPGFEGAKYVMTPPLRPRRNWPRLWQALADGTLDIAATDHCSWLYQTQKIRGRERFDRIPGGIAGIETRGPLMYSEGVIKGRLTRQRLAALLSSNPARLFGLYPRKGAIAVGSDADLVIIDPQRTATVHNEHLHHRVDYTVFEGWQVTGWPVMTISRGCIVARHGEFVGSTGHGRFLARQAGTATTLYQTSAVPMTSEVSGCGSTVHNG